MIEMGHAKAVLSSVNQRETTDGAKLLSILVRSNRSSAYT